ncbi:MAG: hypothetical protein ACRDJC_17745 [Thermomicrobiales bacterium]
MKHFTLRTRLVLIILAALLALPLAPTASPVEAKKRARTVTRMFRNVVPINLPIGESNPVSAGYYPSDVAVGGLKGTIRDVNLRLNNVSHAHPRDLQALLVGPRGQTAIVVSHVGGEFDITDVTLTLDDESAAALPTLVPLQSGAFRPTNALGSAIPFNAPAPATSANAALSVFDGTDPNGTWRLFVQDDFASEDSGVFAGGWELELKVQVKAKKKKR